MKKLLFFLTSALFSISVFSAIPVDIFGIDEPIAHRVLQKYAKRVSEIEGLLQHEAIKFQQGMGNVDLINNKLLPQRDRLKAAIKKEYGFLYVQFDTIDYPDEKNQQYTTIEVVPANHSERLQWVHDAQTKEYIPTKRDLIDQMLIYKEQVFQRIAKNEIDTMYQNCPVYYCLGNAFVHPQLKSYLEIFNKGVVKEKSLILNTLAHDPIPARRESASFLVAHFHDPHEIIRVLLPHVMDPSPDVRNSVILVLGSTMRRAQIKTVDTQPFLALLDSPEISDRNKSLIVLAGMSKTDVAKKIIIQQGGQHLLTLLRLQQPNNHVFAYLILKQLSSKDFGESNYAAWEHWVVQAQAKGKALP